MQTYMSLLSQSDRPIDFQYIFDRSARRQTATENAQDLKEREEQKIIEQKYVEAEKQQGSINFFIEPIAKLLMNAPSSILNELGLRVFTGSRDIPKDLNVAKGLFIGALKRSKNVEDLQQSTYYMSQVQINFIRQQRQLAKTTFNPLTPEQEKEMDEHTIVAQKELQ